MTDLRYLLEVLEVAMATAGEQPRGTYTLHTYRRKLGGS